MMNTGEKASATRRQNAIQQATSCRKQTVPTQQTQNICKTFIKCEDGGPTCHVEFYKCYTL